MFGVDHRLSGLWLPAGGHVEPGEDPAVTTEREELGIEADFSIAGRRPAFVTVTPPRAPDSHTDVSLWYLLAGYPGMRLVLDPREFAGGRWWSGPELEAADQAEFDPHMSRFLAKVRGGGLRGAGLRGTGLRGAGLRGQPRA